MGRDHLVFQGQKKKEEEEEENGRSEASSKEKEEEEERTSEFGRRIWSFSPPFLTVKDAPPTDPRFRSASNFILSFLLEQIRGGDDVFS